MTLPRSRGSKTNLNSRHPWKSRPRLVGLEDRTVPATFVWDVDADGNWNDQTNWFNQTSGKADDGFPNAAADFAILGSKATAARTVTIPDAVTITVNGIQFDNATAGYTVASAGTGKLVFDTAGAQASLDVESGGHTISAPVTLNQSLTATPAASASVTIAAVISESGGPRDLTVSEPGRVVFAAPTGSNAYTGTTTVRDGKLELASAGPEPSEAIVGPLVIGDGAGTAGTAQVILVSSNEIADTVDVVVNSDGLFATGIAPETVKSLIVNPGGSVDGFGLTSTDGSTILGTDNDDKFVIEVASGGATKGKLNDVSIGTLMGAVTFDGKGGTDTITGPATSTAYALTGADAGKVGDSLTFAGVEALVAGDADDTFIPTEGQTFAGSIDGGAGVNTLDYSAFAAGVTVNLGANSPSLLADLDGVQETPPLVTKATGSATVTNYDPVTNKFDIAVTVTNLDPSLVNGFHIHRAPVNVAGPIIVDLQKLATLTPDGTGFKATLTGVSLPAEHQAAFLGGITYVNIHTVANDKGEIRGQLFASAAFVDAPAVVPGVTVVTGISKVVGTAQNDSIVGDKNVNVIVGGGGDDTLVGTKGNDIIQGGDANDIIVWSNGDGTDVMDGEAGTDTVQVNGAVDKGDTFMFSAAGTRVAFERTNFGNFKLDIGTTETLTVNGSGGDEAFLLGDLAGVADLTTLNLNGFAGIDSVIGTDDATTFSLTGPTPGQGSASGAIPAAFTGIENLSGGVADDKFTFADGATIAGTLDGGGGKNALDYSGYTTPVSVNLGANAPGLAGTLQPDQEVPAQSSTASGKFTISNFDPATNKFDITVTVTNLDPALVTGFHIHRAPTGVNGPIIVDFVPIAKLTPDGTGFTTTLTGVQLVAADQAALLGGVTYVNIHTAAAPGGLIRGQVFATGVFVAAPATGTGVGTIVNISSVTGGSAADSLVGDKNVNTLAGGGGKDIIVGVQGNDTIQGGDGDDIMVWNNGDGTDVMDGGAGADTVLVNGSVDKADVFTIAGKSGRVNFQRTNLVPFALDIGTTETLTVVGVGGNDTFTVGDTTAATDLTTINLAGLDDSDIFNVTTPAGPSGQTAVNVVGHQPVPPGTPGDALNVTVPTGAAVTATFTEGASGKTGTVQVGTAAQLGFTGIETVTGVTLTPAGQISTDPFAVGPDAGGGVNVQQYDLTGKPMGAAIPAFGSAVTGGVRVAVADVNGDGTADLIVGAGPGSTPTVKVFDGKTGAAILTFDAFESTFTGGVYVAAADFNNDGKADLIVTPDQGGGPRVRILDGAKAAANAVVPLTDFFGIGDPNFRGGARAAGGDVDGDGIPDLIVAAGFQGGPRVAAFVGKTLFDPLAAVVGAQPPKLFNDFFAFEDTLRNGVFITAGDLDGDGKAELIAGGGPGGGPRVSAFSAADLISSGGGTLSFRANFFAGDPNNRGGIRLTVRDIDGDNRADIIAGAGTNGGSRVTGYAAKSIPVQGDPTATAFAFDAIAGFNGGVFVG